MGEPRQPKRSREELHALLIDAGRSILREEGFGTTSGNLTFKKVYERVERDAGVRLTNASVIRRVWENQAEFQADVLVAIAQDEDRPEIERTIAALSAVFDGLDFSTVESRARADERLRPHVPWPVSQDTHQSTFGTRRPCVCQYARQSPALQLGVAIVAAASTERPYSIGPEARRGGYRGVRARRRDTGTRLTNASVIRRAWDRPRGVPGGANPQLLAATTDYHAVAGAKMIQWVHAGTL